MKEAVVFIIDTSPSMNTPHPNDDSSTTRLECAKQIVISMISDLMIQSKTNEVGVLLCKTIQTKHHKIAESEVHKSDIPFQHLIELTSPPITRPTPQLLRQIVNIQPSIIPLEDDKNQLKDNASSIQQNGDLIDAIILATDAFYERGIKYKFQRKMVLFTDAQHTIVMDVKSTLLIIDNLRIMNCPIEIYGFHFTNSVSYQEPMVVSSTTENDCVLDTNHLPNKKFKTSNQCESKDAPPTGNSNDTNIDQIMYSTKEDCEQLLISLTEKTGGAVYSVTASLQQILQSLQGRRIQNSVQTKFEFIIAPTISFEARFFLLMSKQSFPKLITKVVTVPSDETCGDIVASKDRDPNELLNVQRAELFVDPDDPDEIVDDGDRTKAIQFGSTLIPMSSFDYEGLKPSQMGARLVILGYMDQSKVPLEYLSGPPSGISGHESPKACMAIAALAHALHRSNKVAIGTFYKRSTSTKPLLVTIFPYTDRRSDSFESPELSSGQQEQVHLVILQIPFGGETKKLDLDCFDSYLDVDDDGNDTIGEKSKVCDDLISSLNIPDHVLCSGEVPSPLLRSCNQTKIQRAMNPNAEIVNVRANSNEMDPMQTPSSVLQQATAAIESFETVFGLEKMMSGKLDKPTAPGQTKRKSQTSSRKVLTYKDFI